MTGAEWLAVAILLAVAIWTVASITELHKLILSWNKGSSELMEVPSCVCTPAEQCESCADREMRMELQEWPAAYVAGERKFGDMIGSSFPIDMQYSSDPHRLWSHGMKAGERLEFASVRRRGKSIFQDRSLPIDDPWRAVSIMHRDYRNLEARVHCSLAQHSQTGH